jgi:hypothetical protein
VIPYGLFSTMSFSQTPATREESDDKAILLLSVRDEQRSARRWQDLLSPAERQGILAEIAQVALAIGRDLYPAQDLNDLDIGTASGRGDVCPRERLAFLVSAWPRLSHALRIIETAPASVLKPGIREARIEQGSLRRVSQAAIFAAIRSGDFIFVPTDSSPLARRLRGRLPRHIAETVAVPSSDTPINRAVKSILAQLVRDLGRITLLAQTIEDFAVARQAEELRDSVRQSLRREPWQTLTLVPVQNSYPPASGPAYRYLFHQWRRYRNAFVFDWTNPIFTLPARETWLLYEYSCLFAVARALRDLGFRAVSGEDFALSRSGLTFSLEKGRASRLVFHREGSPRITLRYNPNFPRQERKGTKGWHSRTHSLRPDITLESEGRLLIFDAKFKTYAETSAAEENVWNFRDGALFPDIQQMHTYRDAIVHGEKSNVVAEAWLLYTGRIGVDNPEIVAYPRSQPELPFGTGGVGAFLLRPGRDPKALREFLSWFSGDLGKTDE